MQADTQYVTNSLGVTIVVGAWMNVYHPRTGLIQYSGEVRAIYLGVAPDYEIGTEVHIVDSENNIDVIVLADNVG